MVELGADLLSLAQNLVPGRVLAGHVKKTLMAEELEVALEVAIDKVLFGEVIDERDKHATNVDRGLVDGEEAVLLVGDRRRGERGIVEHHGVAGFGERGEVALSSLKGRLDGAGGGVEGVVDVRVCLGRHVGTRGRSTQLFCCCGGRQETFGQ